MTDPRSSLAAFAAFIGRPLSEVQALAAALVTRITAILAPRQSGKSRLLALLAAWWAARAAGQRVLVVSAGEDAARRLLREVRDVLTASDLARSVLDEQSALIRLSNGSEVRSVPASERAIRGWSTDLLLIDEAALVSDDVLLSAAFPTTSARPDARIVMASSPWAEGGAFYDTVMAGDSEHVRVHRWTLEDAPWISPAVVEAARASMPAARFAAEYLAEWSSSLDALFSRAVLERASADLSLPSIAELRGPARVLGGSDWGVVSDRSAVAWLARVPVAHLNDLDPERPVYIADATAWPAGEPLSNVTAQIAASPAHWDTFSSETTGVGAGPTQELWKRLRERPWEAGGGTRPARVVVVPEHAWDTLRPPQRAYRPTTGFVSRKVEVATSAQTKALVYERLRWLIDREQLILPRGSDLVRELAALRLELRPGGGERIEARAGHDDLADSLYLATAPYRGRGGRLRCLLADLAERRSAEAPVPALDEPVVETGGGLRVYRRPPLQSVAGDEVTLPVGARERPTPMSPTLLAAQKAARETLQAIKEESAA